ncbi:hypothetical protein TNCV_2355331 [Trichonephila clavipes]|nr:hypothetical protein TNCV_2355331 [Trichonephila clavipes]
MDKIRKTPPGLDCPIALLEEFIAVGDNVCTASIMADTLEFVQSSKDIDPDSDDKNAMNNADHVPTSSEMGNVMKSMRSYLDAHNGETKNKLDNIEQFDAKKAMQRKIDYFPKTINVLVFKKN